MMRRACFLLLALGGLAWAPWSGPAAAQPAETYRVVGVGTNDVLNIRTGPSVSFPIAGAMPPDARGIRGLGSCVEGWCPVRFGSVTGWSSARFLAVDSDDSGSAEPTPGAGEPDDTAATRRVLEDGTLEIRFADGSARRRLPTGQLQNVRPDGTVTTLTFVQTQTADLPPLPAQYEQWGSRLGSELLSILGNILTSAEMEAYLQTEAGKGYYELVDWRLRSIEFLMIPGS
jgi:hypothetical protein